MLLQSPTPCADLSSSSTSDHCSPQRPRFQSQPLSTPRRLCDQLLQLVQGCLVQCAPWSLCEQARQAHAAGIVLGVGRAGQLTQPRPQNDTTLHSRQASHFNTVPAASTLLAFLSVCLHCRLLSQMGQRCGDAGCKPGIDLFSIQPSIKFHLPKQERITL